MSIQEWKFVAIFEAIRCVFIVWLLFIFIWLPSGGCRLLAHNSQFPPSLTLSLLFSLGYCLTAFCSCFVA